MPAIEFTQYMRPSGRPVPVSIDRPAEIAALARKIEAAGYRFECEVLGDNTSSFTIADDDGDAEIELAPNAPGEASKAIDKMIERFAARLQRIPSGAL